MPRTIPTVETINQTVGSRIKRLREDMGISQRGLCRLAGLSPTTLITVENGSGSISAVNLLAVAEALDTTPDWFYGDLLMESRHRDQLDRNWKHWVCRTPPSSPR
jgi:transcriptional regulator with XRE-family HTH domain